MATPTRLAVVLHSFKSARACAGATIDTSTLATARHLDAQKFLDNNDATSYFEVAGGLIVRGPTQTNVNDFRVILIDA